MSSASSFASHCRVAVLTFLALCSATGAYAEGPPTLTCPTATGREATIVLPQGEATRLPAGATWLVVSTEAAGCVGQAAWHPGLRTLTVHGDDPLTAEVDGAAPGETLEFELYDAAGLLVAASFSLTLDEEACHGCQRTFTYVHDGIYAIENIEGRLATDVAPEATAQEARVGVPFPSPTSTLAHVDVYLPEAQHVRAVVYDALGREVYRVHDAVMPSGSQRLLLPAERLPSGSYLLRVSARSLAETRAFVVAR